MPDWSQVGRTHVLAAIADYDRLGQREFLRRFGFGRSRAYTLWHRGSEYDSRAILGVAYLHATGRVASSSDFSGGEAGAAKVLSDLGFDVVVDEEALAATPQRATRTAAPRPTPRKRPEPRAVQVCPRCHMALPASGTCDTCD